MAIPIFNEQVLAEKVNAYIQDDINKMVEDMLEKHVNDYKLALRKKLASTAMAILSNEYIVERHQNELLIRVKIKGE